MRNGAPHASAVSVPRKNRHGKAALRVFIGQYNDGGGTLQKYSRLRAADAVAVQWYQVRVRGLLGTLTSSGWRLSRTGADLYSMGTGWKLMRERAWQTVGLVLSLATASGCGVFSTSDGAPRHRPDAASIPDAAVVRAEPKSRYGNPSSYVVLGRRYHVLDSAHGYIEQGVASWYGTKFHGKRTSSGETYDMHKMTAAHKSLPLPTYARVTNLENGRQTVVRVNDRGPFHGDRLIDLSYAAAIKLGLEHSGTARVEVAALEPLATTPPAVPGDDARVDGKDVIGREGGAPVVDKGRALSAVRHLAPSAVASPSSPLPQAAPSASSGGALYIQVGSFRFRENAERWRSKLRAVGLSPQEMQVQVEQIDAERYYRVLIGPLNGDTELDRRADELNRLGIDGYLVVEP